MSLSKSQILKFVGLSAIAAATTFILLNLSAFFISGLPRPQQGEAIAASWRLCILGSFAVAVFVPWVTSFALLGDSTSRIYFLASLALTAVVWYYGALDELFSKAYRRGL